MGEVEPIRIHDRTVDVLDQTLLPAQTRYLRLESVESLCESIASLRVRGAPLLGLMGAAGLAIAASTGLVDDASLATAAERIASVRPTAADLRRGALEALDVALSAPREDRADALWAHLAAFAERRRAEDNALAGFGATLLASRPRVLTHCNTGALATGGIGTALGCIRMAHESGAIEHVFATETRPLLQGARLTMWELGQLGIPATLIADSAAASLILSGAVDAVITGADRIAANGDTANKVGTVGLALASARAGAPFYIAAPLSTFDAECPSGAAIPIEDRDPDEVLAFQGVRTAPATAMARNPAFDVTPADLITAIATERGVAFPPYLRSLASLAGLTG